VRKRREGEDVGVGGKELPSTRLRFGAALSSSLD